MRDFTYDNLHRETAEKWMSGGTPIYTISYAYNADNAVTSASDPDSSYAYTLDHLGRVTSLDNSSTPNIPHVVLSSQYDALGDRTQLTATVAGTADFLNAYTYDADQNLLQATQEGQTGGNGVAPKGVGYAYNLDGQITSVLDFDPTTSSPHPDIAYGTYSYDAGNRLTEIDYKHSSTTLDDLTWSYDAANRVTGFTSSVDGSASYSYNTTNEVTAASYTGTHQPANESYSFDSNGNRTNTGYTTGTNNQLTGDGTFDYTYDHEGNRVIRTRISSAPANDYLTTYSYDYRDRLTDVDYYNNSSVLTGHVHYVYDVYDHLIGTEIDATGGGTYTSSQWYALDITADPNAPALPVLQFDSSGNETYRFLNGPSAAGVDAVMAQEGITTQGSPGATDYMLVDDLGSVRDIVNTSSAVDDHIVYNSFGQAAYESNSAIAHWAGFAGYHTDPTTGLDYAGRRWYDPSVGRWISEDPIGFGGGDTNVTRYVGNNLATAIDPWGLATVSIGINFTFTFIFVDFNASINVNVGPNGASLGPTLGIGPALGGGIGIGPQVMVTNASSVQALNGLSGQIGGYVDCLAGAGLAYVFGPGYSGLCGSVSAGGGAALYLTGQYSWAWFTWATPAAPSPYEPPGSNGYGTDGPSSGNGGQYLNQGQ